MLLLQQMTAFFLFMLIGYYIRRKDILDDKGCSGISWIVANLANPALIISGAVNAEGNIPITQVVFILGLGTAVYFILVIASMVLPYILRVPAAQKGEYRNFLVFSNVGFMGYPLISALLGPQAVLYASIFTIPFNFLLYTYCIYNFGASKKGMEAEKEKKKIKWKDILNIGVLACIAALVLNFTNYEVPGFVRITITNLANLTAALSMINIGTFLIKIKLRELFTDVRMLTLAGIKMLIVPVVGTLLLRNFIKDTTMITIAMIILATPVASMVAILAERSDGDSRLATKAVALTTFASVITIPLVSAILKIA